MTRGLGALAFAVICTYALRKAPGFFPAALGVGGAAMFGAFALDALFQLLRPGPRLVLRREGFEAADLGVGLVPWDQVAVVDPFGSAEAPFIAFRLADPKPWIPRLPPWARRVRRLHAASGLPAFSVSLIGVDRDAAEVTRRAQALHGAAR
jgi:hypothetical protein